MTPEQQNQYKMGAAARAEGLPLEACNIKRLDIACAWKAGHHDMDYQLGVRVYRGPERRKAA